ncbi:MAG: nucleotidyltransferase family protein [Bacteroidales bacterium]|nr:nucleotidyltransferase family protein [Bacteroidales bacterium]
MIWTFFWKITVFFSRAADCLTELGFQHTNYPKLNLKFSRNLFRMGKQETCFIKKRTRTVVDLHFRPVANSFFSNKIHKDFFNEKSNYLLNDTEIPILSPEKYFLFLCYHGAIHHYSSLHWLNDVLVFAVKVPLDQEKIQKTGHTFKVEEPCSDYLCSSL